MRIGMVTAAYEPIQNGVTRMVSLYKKHLEQRGHEVTIFTLGSKSELCDAHRIVISRGLQYGESGYFVAFRYMSQARVLLKEMDIVHCHHPIMGLELARRYARCPIVFTNHTRYDLYSAALSPIPDNAAIRASSYVMSMLLKKSDWIIAPTKDMSDILKEWGVKTPIEVISNGIELEKYRNPSSSFDKKNLGILDQGILATYVGRLSAEKGVETLLDAFALAKYSNPKLHLLLVGDGPSRNDLERRTDELKIQSSVRFIGQVPFAEIPGYLASADFFVSASKSEVQPLSVMEAMAAALPIVGYRSPGLNGLVQHGANAILCGPSSEQLARGIIGVASDRNRRRSMSESSLELSEIYDIRNTIDKSLTLYSRMLSNHSSTVRKFKKRFQTTSSSLNC